MSQASHRLQKRALEYYKTLDPALLRIRLEEYSQILSKLRLTNATGRFKPWDEAALRVLRYLVLKEPL